MLSLLVVRSTARTAACADGAALKNREGRHGAPWHTIAMESRRNPLGDRALNPLDRDSVANPAHAIHCDRLNS